MKSKLTLFFVLVLVLIISACAPPQVSATQPAEQKSHPK
jgi:hypothetical protein